VLAEPLVRVREPLGVLIGRDRVDAQLRHVLGGDPPGVEGELGGQPVDEFRAVVGRPVDGVAAGVEFVEEVDGALGTVEAERGPDAVVARRVVV
jgi:hypothetical protein